MNADVAVTSEESDRPPISFFGLSEEEAARRLREFGPNDPAPRRHGELVFELLLLFVNPLVVILLVASILSALLGQRADAVIIFVIAMSSVAINFFQTYRSGKAIRRLREHVCLTATVFREGAWRDIRRSEIVPGDVVRLGAGDLVPADGRLLESRDLFVQQAALTGESMPVEKEAGAAIEKVDKSPTATNLVFLGTSVVSGAAVVSVTDTGGRTSFGLISARLRDRAGETEFERGLREFGFLIMRVVLFLILFILIVRVALHRDPFESFIFAVALAVGLTPEFLPMITSVTLARGAVRMAKEEVIVKHLPAIQNFGSIDVLCSDKTGTLTTGVMTLHIAVDAMGESSARPLSLAYLNSKFETGIRSPLDVAVLECSKDGSAGFTKCDEVPFDFSRRRLSVVVERAGVEGSKRLLITKGAPEGIVELCDGYQAGEVQQSFDAETRAQTRKVYEGLCEQGFRVLAVASRLVETRDGFSAADERCLMLAGYLAFADPPNPDVAKTLSRLKRDGVDVKILTGDNELVTRHICGQVGFQEAVIVLGPEIDAMTDPALSHVAEQANVFARVTPMQKLRILRALRQRGHVVGYIGDGINDAPALHAADVGISVASAVDVARDAADIILLRPGLKVLHRGVREGRRTFANTLKYVFFAIAANFGYMFSLAVASLFLPFEPLLAAQILLVNLLADFPAMALATDSVDPEQVRRPRRWDVGFVTRFMLSFGLTSSCFDFLTFGVMYWLYGLDEKTFHTGWFVESTLT